MELSDEFKALVDDPHSGRLMFKCECGCCQSHSDGVEIGIPINIAKETGWRFEDGLWRCPECCGNGHITNQVFFGEFDAGPTG